MGAANIPPGTSTMDAMSELGGLATSHDDTGYTFPNVEPWWDFWPVLGAWLYDVVDARYGTWGLSHLTSISGRPAEDAAAMRFDMAWLRADLDGLGVTVRDSFLTRRWSA